MSGYALRLRNETALQGFTLVEVVVALAILSLVMLATITGLRTLANTQVSLERLSERTDQVRTVSSFLRDTMESAVVGGGANELSLGAGTTGAEGYFEFSPESIAWRSTILIGEYFGGSYLVRVAREDNALVLRWQQPDARGLPGDWLETESRTLVEPLEEFSVSWRENRNGDWQEAWREGATAQWVRLQLRSSDRYWPELIMEVPQ